MTSKSSENTYRDRYYKLKSKYNNLELTCPSKAQSKQKPEPKPEPKPIVIDTCNLPKKYFGNTNENNINCKITLQDQLQNDRDVSRILIVFLTCILPILLLVYGINNISTLGFVHYILFFAIISLSIITLASVEGITFDKSFIIYPEEKDCNSCKFNGKLSLIGIGIGIVSAIIIYLINYIISTFL